MPGLEACIVQAVPVLLVRQEWDQPMNADRVVHHGLGFSLPNQDAATPQAIAEGLYQLLSNKRYPIPCSGWERFVRHASTARLLPRSATVLYRSAEISRRSRVRLTSVE